MSILSVKRPFDAVLPRLRAKESDESLDSLSRSVTKRRETVAATERPKINHYKDATGTIGSAEARQSLRIQMNNTSVQLPNHYDAWKILGGSSLQGKDRTDVITGNSGRKIVLIGGGYDYAESDNSVQCESLAIVSIPWHANTIHELITIAAGGHYASGLRSNGGLRARFAFDPDPVIRSSKFLSTETFSHQGVTLAARPTGTRRSKAASLALGHKRSAGLMTPETALSTILSAPETLHFPSSLIDLRDPDYKHVVYTREGIELIRQLRKTIYKHERGSAFAFTHLSVSDVLARYLNQMPDPAAFVQANRDFLRELAVAETKRTAQAAFIRNRKLQRHIPMSKGEYYSECYAALHEKVIAMLSIITDVESFPRYGREQRNKRDAIAVNYLSRVREY